MINAMRTLALDYLFDKLGDKDNPPQNLEEWYCSLRNIHPEQFFPFLVEDVSDIEKVYILYPDKTDSSMVNMEVEDITKEKACKLPFIQYRARAIGPVVKRSKTKGEVSPNITTQQATLKYFEKVGNGSSPWASYFKDIFDILRRPKLRTLDGSVIMTGRGETWSNIYSATLELIPDEKVMVAVADRENKWPGESPEYLNYLASELSMIKYCTGDTPAKDNQSCPLCGATDVPVFPNALKGAGINISNADRAGAFPDIDTTQAWKGYALCNACADLLYVYKFYFLKNDSNGRNLFRTPIAGENAVVIPFAAADYRARQNIWREVKDFVKDTSSDAEEAERNILDVLKEKKGILNLTFLWATVGQNIKDVTGMITNVPPTRLKELSELNEESRNWGHPLFPATFLWNDFRPELSLRTLSVLFKRPGGKKAKNVNASMKLCQLKRGIAASVYHKTEISTPRFWEEVMTTARWYWLDAIENGNAYGLLNEGKKETGKPYLTAADWIRHLCWWLYYFKRLEVMSVEDNFYEPQMEKLKPYFGHESGIDSAQKAYAFLLGVLYGKVLQVQGARGVNVGANALTWLKRLTLKGRDLPELYIKTREKLLAYETEKNKEVRELIVEIGNLGCKLGDNIKLEEIPTNYYLLLGQSLTTTILSKKEEKANE
ncbi:MAG: TM1802 family CRISPR-associated protein [bacterium]|nr:TM1802 family CRISPR-associated protein [bacterium]